ncbi:MAG: hypothetical protein Q4Q17_03740 [Tissierellia bacterium]|nr:hypothetical protein [Tissierellia bacterium]
MDNSTISYNSDFKGKWSQIFIVDNRTSFYHANGSQVRDFSEWARFVRTKNGSNAAGDDLEIEYEKIGDKYYARIVRFKRSNP